MSYLPKMSGISHNFFTHEQKVVGYRYVFLRIFYLIGWSEFANPTFMNLPFRFKGSIKISFRKVVPRWYTVCILLLSERAYNWYLVYLLEACLVFVRRY